MTVPQEYLIEFLAESNALEGLSEPAGTLDATATGHSAAPMDSQRRAEARTPLQAEVLVRWHRQVTDGAPLTGPRPALAALLRDLISSLNRGQPTKIADVVQLIADSFHRFYAIKAFPDANGQVGRLLANYIATCCGAPILIFRRKDRRELARGINDILAMRLYVAAKLREAIYDEEGNLMLRTKSFGSTDVYRAPQGRTILLEWHELLDACDGWRSGAG
jgi:hypothetical protein